MHNEAVRRRPSTELYRRMLLAKRSELLSDLDANFSSLGTIGRLAAADEASLSHEEFVSLRLNSLLHRHLSMVEQALDRLDAGDYGICAGCGAPISAPRLRALPWAIYCLDCQDRAVPAHQQAEEGGSADERDGRP